MPAFSLAVCLQLDDLASENSNKIPLDMWRIEFDMAHSQSSRGKGGNFESFKVYHFAFRGWLRPSRAADGTIRYILFHPIHDAPDLQPLNACW